MEAWLKEPLNTVVADFEFAWACRPREDSVVELEIFPLQIAVANAHGDWVVPVTSINHDISKRALFAMGAKLPPCHQRGTWEAMVCKFYGTIDDTETQGLSWTEIAGLIDDYTKVRGSINF